MKTVTVRLLSLLALAAAMGLGQTQEQDVKGWSTAKWGMSLQQIREAFPSAGVVKPAKEDYTAFGRLKSHVCLRRCTLRHGLNFQPIKTSSALLIWMSITLEPIVPRHLKL
jgi:hypothetical protein